MSILTTIVIGTTAYSSNGIAYAGFSGSTYSWGSARIFGLRFTGNDESYSTLEFSAIGCGPTAPFVPGVQVQLVISNPDGSSPSIKFTGDLQKPAKRDSEQGPAWGFTCTDLRTRADRITLLSNAGLAVASYNLSPTDPLYLFSLAGQTVGQILTDVLQSAANAAALSGVGVGNYTLSMGVYTLPSQTTTDFAALGIVPPVPVQLQGESILNILQAFLQQWMAQYTLYIQPDGTIRVISIFGRTSNSLTQPSASVAGDPIDSLEYDVDTQNCYSAVQILGQNIAGVTLSYVDGTLTHSTSAPSSPPWTLSDFTQPAGANDQGNSSSVTSTNCVVTSDQSTTHWIANFWNNNGGIIVLYNLAASGISITETRQVTSCTALSAGGTATITWDSSLPIDSTSYTRYRLYATNTTRSLWDREFLVTEPATGATGLSTYIGSHMYPIFPYGYAWGNLGKGADQLTTINYPAAKVQWSSSGAYPWFEVPVGVSIDPTKGTVILNQPAVVLSAGLAGQSASLNNGYPGSTYMGLWHDIQVAIPYSRGQIGTRYPSSGFQGTSYTKYGLQRVKTIALSTFNWQGDAASLNQLAQQHLLVVQDAVASGSIRLLYDAFTFTWDPLTVGYAIQINTPGAASEIDGLTLPVRSFTMEWPNDGPNIHTLTLTFSNRHRQFEGDALYIHPMFSAHGWGTQDGNLFVAGSYGGLSGVTEIGSLPSFGDSSVPSVPSQEPEPTPEAMGPITAKQTFEADMAMPQTPAPKPKTEAQTRKEAREKKQRDAAAAAKEKRALRSPPPKLADEPPIPGSIDGGG